MPRQFARQPRSDERSEFMNGNAVTVNSQVAEAPGLVAQASAKAQPGRQ